LITTYIDLFLLSTGQPATLSTQQLRVDSNNRQSVIRKDHHKGNRLVTEDKFNRSSGEALVVETTKQSY